jgi:hypothetical protein
MSKKVTVPDYLIEKCMDYAERVVAHYTAGDDREANLPWTSADLSTEEFKQWVASRKEAGRVINIETCELGRWHAHDCDPRRLGENRGRTPLLTPTRRLSCARQHSNKEMRP